MSSPSKKTLRDADLLARENLSDARYGHTLRVAETAMKLARTHGADEGRARLAALIHDAERELPGNEYLRRARVEGIPFGDEECENPKLLHGALAAETAKRRLGVKDAGVLQAVREHTVGAAGMSKLSLVLYLADKIEPARDYPSVEEIRAMARKDLITATAEALKRSIAYGESRGKEAHPESRAALRWLESSTSRSRG